MEIGQRIWTLKFEQRKEYLVSHKEWHLWYLLLVGLGIQGGITKDVSARIGAVASFNTYGQEYGGGAELRFKF